MSEADQRVDRFRTVGEELGGNGQLGTGRYKPLPRRTSAIVHDIESVVPSDLPKSYRKEKAKQKNRLTSDEYDPSVRFVADNDACGDDTVSVAEVLDETYVVFTILVDDVECYVVEAESDFVEGLTRELNSYPTVTGVSDLVGMRVPVERKSRRRFAFLGFRGVSWLDNDVVWAAYQNSSIEVDSASSSRTLDMPWYVKAGHLRFEIAALVVIPALCGILASGIVPFTLVTYFLAVCLAVGTMHLHQIAASVFESRT